MSMSIVVSIWLITFIVGIVWLGELHNQRLEKKEKEKERFYKNLKVGQMIYFTPDRTHKIADPWIGISRTYEKDVLIGRILNTSSFFDEIIVRVRNEKNFKDYAIEKDNVVYLRDIPWSEKLEVGQYWKTYNDNCIKISGMVRKGVFQDQNGFIYEGIESLWPEQSLSHPITEKEYEDFIFKYQISLLKSKYEAAKKESNLALKKYKKTKLRVSELGAKLEKLGKVSA